MATGSKKPDMRLKFLNKTTSEKGDLGAAWKNDDGTINIRLNAKVVLTQEPDEILTLFPAEYTPKYSSAPKAVPPGTYASQDEVPF